MKADGIPLIVDGIGISQTLCVALERLPFTARNDRQPAATYQERWLQQLVQDHPALLPIERIEPALASPIPVCMELPLPSGYADNLMITEEGGIVLIETKLWRNPEARREVVGQILDYAKDLARMSYERLQDAIRLARAEPNFSIFDFIRQHNDGIDEARFIDAVSRNLRMGRMLLLVVGDGIQEGAEQLGEFLQQHVGLSFSLALVEMALWKLPASDRVVVQPRVLSRTVQIERAVIRVEASVGSPQISVLPPEQKQRQTPTTITTETFYEALAQSDSQVPERLQALLSALEPLGVVGEVRKFMTLKWRGPGGKSFGLATIDPAGVLATDTVNWDASAIGRIDLAHQYQADIAALVPGGSVRHTAKMTGWRVVLGNSTANPPVRLLLDKADGWIAAIERYVESLSTVLEAQE